MIGGHPQKKNSNFIPVKFQPISFYLDLGEFRVVYTFIILDLYINEIKTKQNKNLSCEKKAPNQVLL